MATETDKLIIDIIVNNRKAIAAMNEFAKTNKVTIGEIKSANNQIINAQNRLAEKNEKAFGRMKNNIMSAGLSMLFTGMAMKKMFQDIATTAITTYNKINANTALANNAVTRLAISMDYVYYVIGDALSSALDSIMPMILSVVDAITDWIEQNPELSGQILLWGIIISSVVMVLGQMGLAVLGIISALQLLGVVKGASMFTDIAGGATSAASEVNKAGSAIDVLKGAVNVALSLALTLIGWELLENGLNNDNLLSTIAGAILTVGGAIGLGAATGKMLALAGASGFTGPLALIFGISAGIIVAMKLLGFDFSEGGQDVLRNWLYKLKGGKMKEDIPEQDISDIIHAKDPENWRINIEGNWERIKTTMKNVTDDVNNTIVPNTNQTLKNIDNTTNNIKNSVDSQSKVIDDLGNNTVKANENISVLATDTFSTNVTNIDADVDSLAKSMRKFSKIDFNSIYRQQSNNALGILAGR